MCEIAIEKPIGFKMDIVEMDDYMPSIKILIDVEISHPTGFFKYKANNIWFECSKWDIFSNGLLDLNSNKKLLLENMSEQFKIMIEKKSDNNYLFELFCFEPEMGAGLTKLNFSATVDLDKLSQIVNAFSNFSKWW